MPSKGRQRASRQAQLRKSSKKSSRKNKPAIDSKLADPLTNVKQPDVKTQVSVTEATNKQLDPVAPKSVPQTQSPRQNAGALEYPYLKSELRQIGMTCGLVIIAVIALTFVPWS